MGRQILLIGIGESGCKCMRSFSQKTNRSDVGILSVDTDMSVNEYSSSSETVSLARNERLFETVSILDGAKLGTWFPYDFEDTQNEFIKSVRMDNGTGLWRTKALLQFVCHMADEENKNSFCNYIDGVAKNGDAEKVEIYVVASLAGGTGSGLLLPVTLFVKKYIKEKFGKDSIAKAILFSPEIYSGVLRGEQYVKAEANAYAALAELNAVNLSICGNENDCLAPEYRLGDERDPILGLLWDCRNKEFTENAPLPFESVYVCGKQPGTESVSVHIDNAASVIKALISSEAPDKKGECKNTRCPIFGSALITKIKYPWESIAEYLGTARVTETYFRRWSELYGRLSELAKNKAEMRLMCGEKNEKPVKNYAEGLESMFSDLGNGIFTYKSTNVPESIVSCLGKDTDILSEISDLDLIDGAEEKIYSYFKDEFEAYFEERSDLEREINKIKTPHGQKKHLWERGASLENIFTELCDGVLEEKLREKGDEFRKELNSADGNISLIKKVIRLDGEAADPVASALRLSALYLYLDKETKIKLGTERILSVPIYKGKKCRYAKGGVMRFAMLAQKERSVCGTLTADKELFLDDAELIFAKVRRKLRNAFFEIMLDEVEQKLGYYVDFFRALSFELDSIEGELSRANRKDGASVGTDINVYASLDDRNTALNSFIKAIKEAEIKDVLDSDMLLYTEGYILSGEKNFESYRDALTSMAIKNVKESPFCRDHLKKNIIEAINDPDPGVCAVSNKGATVRKIMSVANPSLKVTADDTGSRSHIISYTGLLLSDRLNREDTSEIEGIFYSFGESADSIAFTSEAEENELYVVKQIMGLSVHELDLMNEDGRETGAYMSCRKALSAKKTRYSELWEPYILPGMNLDVPPVSPKARAEKEKRLIKAFVYGYANKQLRLPENGEEYCRYLLDAVEYPMEDKDGNGVKLNDINGIIRWISKNEDISDLWYDAYTEWETRGISRLPAADTVFSDVEEFTVKLCRNGFICNVAEAAAVLRRADISKALVNRLSEYIESIISDISKQYSFKEKEMYCLTEELQEKLKGA